MTIKIRGLFQEISKLKGLSLQVSFVKNNRTFEQAIELTKKKKFKLSLDRDDLFDGKESALLTFTLRDLNEDSSNFKKNRQLHDLDLDEQIFNFTVNNKKKAKLKFAPTSSPLSNDNTSPSLDPPKWTLGPLTQLEVSGVSAHLESYEDGYRVTYAGAGALNIAEMDTNFNLTHRGTIERGADLTVIEIESGVRRGYYVELNPETQDKEIFSANISDDGLILSNPISTGFSDQGARAWGVPDAVRLPDGRVRLYWVEDPDMSIQADEIIVSATSTDASGTIFSRDAGIRTSGGYVDFEVLRAEPNDWIAVMSSSPETIPTKAQGIYVGTSADGLNWTVQPDNLSPASMSYLDPTGIAIGDDQWQLVLSESLTVLGERDYNLVATTLSLD